MITIKTKIIAFALSVFSIGAIAQCPTITSLNVSYGSAGIVTVTPVSSGSITSTTHLYWSAPSASTIGTGVFHYSANGTYSVCVTLIDSIRSCYSNLCVGVNITSVSSTSCHANYTHYADSSCVTHFINTSTGTALAYKWYVDGVLTSTALNYNSSLTGNHLFNLVTFSGGVMCDSLSQHLTLTCGTSSTSCHANYTHYTDSSCVTHFISTSTGTALTYDWLIDGVSYATANPTVALANGVHVVALATWSGGVYCDSIGRYVTIACGSTSTATPCHVSYVYYTDSSCVTHFVSTSTGGIYTDFRIDGVPYYSTSIVLTLTNGIHNVVLSIGCDSLIGTINVLCGSTSTIAVTGVREINATESISLNAYPNPIDGYLTIEVANAETNDFEYKLIDALGRVVLNGTIYQEKITVSTFDLAKGFYSLMVSNKKGNAIKTVKLIK